MIHNSLVCETAARRRLEERSAAEAARRAAETALVCAPADEPLEAEDRPRDERTASTGAPVAMPTRTGSDQRRAQFASEMSAERLGASRDA